MTLSANACLPSLSSPLPPINIFFTTHPCQSLFSLAVSHIILNLPFLHALLNCYWRKLSNSIILQSSLNKDNFLCALSPSRSSAIGSVLSLPIIVLANIITRSFPQSLGFTRFFQYRFGVSFFCFYYFFFKEKNLSRTIATGQPPLPATDIFNFRFRVLTTL